MNRTRLISLGLVLIAICGLPLVACAPTPAPAPAPAPAPEPAPPPAAEAAPPATPAPAPVTGTVQSVSDGSLQLRTADMQQARVTLSPQTRIVKTVPAKLTDVRSGDFIGTTAETRDGKLVSTEVHIFAEALRGTGEGHYPWNQPNTTMTNGAVATMTNGNVAKSDATTGATSLTVTYKGGQQDVTVPASTPVTRIDMAAPADLKAGSRVTVFGRPKADGRIAADMLSIAPGGCAKEAGMMTQQPPLRASSFPVSG